MKSDSGLFSDVMFTITASCYWTVLGPQADDETHWIFLKTVRGEFDLSHLSSCRYLSFQKLHFWHLRPTFKLGERTQSCHSSNKIKSSFLSSFANSAYFLLHVFVEINIRRGRRGRRMRRGSYKEDRDRGQLSSIHITSSGDRTIADKEYQAHFTETFWGPGPGLTSQKIGWKLKMTQIRPPGACNIITQIDHFISLID